MAHIIGEAVMTGRPPLLPGRLANSSNSPPPARRWRLAASFSTYLNARGFDIAEFDAMATVRGGR
jgi:hypothetical protein